MSAEAVADSLSDGLLHAVILETLERVGLVNLTDESAVVAARAAGLAGMAMLMRLQNAAVTLGYLVTVADLCIEAGRVAQAESL